MVDLEQALEFIKSRLKSLEPLSTREAISDEWIVWRRTTTSGLKHYFGEDSDECRWFAPPPKAVWIGGRETAEQKVARNRREYSEWIGESKTALQSILEKYEALGPSIGAPEPPKDTAVAKAFVSHGGRRPSLTAIEDFLRALGVEPIVVEKRASEGRELHDNVDRYRQLSDFAIVLWTRDVEDAKGKWLASGSVAEESGELRAQFRDRVIYLKEKDVELPAMSDSLVFESFAEDNMAPAFLKIVTELHAWGWLSVAALA
jgi:hypothetical protein